MEKFTVQELKELLRNPFVWPGGYEIIFIANDCEFLCHKCVKDNFKIILDSMMHNINDGWNLIGFEVSCNVDITEETQCSNCYKQF